MMTALTFPSLAKPSKPARAYFQLLDRFQLEALAEKVKTASFLDARGTANDPPVLEFAQYGRVPTGKRRNDARQGTIDQDPEFIEFLESLTNPIQKPKPLENAGDIKASKEDHKITPLIQHLREKKAAKDKAPKEKVGKHGKKAIKDELADESKVDKKNKDDGPVNNNEKKSGRRNDKNATRDSPGKASKKDTKAPASPQQSKAQLAAKSTSDGPREESVAKKQSSSTPATAAARMLQRDLGIRGGRAGGGSRRGGSQQSPEATKVTANGANPANNADSPKPEPAVGSQTQPSKVSSDTLSTPADKETKSSQVQHNRLPKAPPNTSKSPPTGPSTKTTSPANSKSTSKVSPNVTPTATRAFLKHANPSQGITEPLLHKALSPFGQVTQAVIDKRKGFAYVDFAEPAGLQAAIVASPIPVAQGNVQVLERKDRVSPAADVVSAAAAARQPAAKPAHMGPMQGSPMRVPRGAVGPALRGTRGGRGRGAVASARGGGATGASGAPGGPNGVANSNAVPATKPTSSQPAKTDSSKVDDPT